MHELSIAMEVLDITRREAASHGASTVKKVHVKIGDLSGVETESLSFCFDGVKSEHPLTRATVLVIERIPVRVYCAKCDDEFEAAGFLMTCPSCGGYDTRLITGEELEIGEIEVE